MNRFTRPPLIICRLSARRVKRTCSVVMAAILVLKRLDAPCRSGRARTWIKVRNKKAPAYTRIEDGTF